MDLNPNETLKLDQIRGIIHLVAASVEGLRPENITLLDSKGTILSDLVADDLEVAEIYVDEGPVLRRYRPRALGRATRIDKRTSHISVALRPGDEG